MKGLLLVLAVLIVGCAKDEKAEAIARAKVDSIMAAITAKTDSIKAANTFDASEAARLAELEAKFKIKGDEFSEVKWYEHKQYPSKVFRGKYLTASVNTSGYCYLSSIYMADDWVFHKSATIKVGNKIYETGEGQSTTDVFDGGAIYESVAYTNDADNGALRGIAMSGGEPIKVRLHGKYYVDFDLSKASRTLIQDSYELGELIKARNRASVK